MKNVCIFILFALLSAIGVQGATEDDFVAQIMERVSKTPKNFPASEYENITVGPAMIKSVLDMMGDEDNMDFLPGDNTNGMGELKGVLEDVKSLRMFIVKDKADKYNALVKQLFNKNKRIYKEFTASDQLGDNKHVYTRQSGNNVVEIVLVEEAAGENKSFQILDLTGSFSDGFFNKLMKIR